MTHRAIKSDLVKELINLQLTDAHRHSLYDIDKIPNMEYLSVDEWSRYNNFLQYQQKTKSLFGKELLNELKEWLDFSVNENISTILDFSAKHASEDLKNIYTKYNIQNFSTIKWTKFSSIHNTNIPDFVILPDERLLTKNIISNAISISKQYPTIQFTMHCLESDKHKKIAFDNFRMSTIEWLSKNNFLSNKLYLVHLNEISAHDIQLIRNNHVKVVLCPLMRKPLNYKNPIIPLDLDIYFGTDAPLISKNRSLIDSALCQADMWLATNKSYADVLNCVIKGLVNKIEILPPGNHTTNLPK